VEHLSDGGALVLLSPSPLDYIANPAELDRRRLEIKKHLGLEAFDTGDPGYRGRVPVFRYEKQWRAEQAKHFLAPRRSTGILSKTLRREWKDWMENNEAISLAFASEMENKGVTLDYSEVSLDELDRYIESRNETEKSS